MSDHERGLTGHQETRAVFEVTVHCPTPDIATVAGHVTIDPAGRFRLTDLTVIPTAGRYVNTDLWKAVPVAKIETVLNDPLFRDEQLANWKQDPDYRIIFHGSLDDWYQGTVERKASLRLVPLPKELRYPDSFYRKVAAAYIRLVREGRPPSQTLSEINQVPTTTVNRWVREARARGLLAPAGGKGRIG